MTGDVNVGDCLVVDLSSLAEKVVNGAVDHFFIAWDRGSRENNGVTGLNAYKTVILVGDAREGGSWLALAASTDDDHPFGWEFVDVLGSDESSLGNTHVAQFDSHLDVVDHAAPNESDLPLITHGGINDLLHT